VPSSRPDPRRLVARAARSPALRTVADRTRTRRSVATIARSGLFDATWYRAQLAPDEVVPDPVEHFVEEGAGRGLQPHPLFDPAFARAADPSAARSAADPFTHHLAGAGRRGHDPHPLFDARLVAERDPAARRHAHGPLGWYLADLDREVAPPTTLLPAHVAPTPRDYLALVREVHRRHAAVPDHRGFPRSLRTFDHQAAERFVAEQREAARDLPTRPWVSVIIPTRDRADVLPAAIRSALAQTWPEVEVVVVDDGSTDGTDQVVASLGDDRVRYVRQEPSGVSRARNRGLEVARGRYVAYLDSDNTWEPETLEVMVAFLERGGHRAGYSAIELRGEGEVAYRGAPVDRDALRERNYVDLNTLVAERDLIREVGGFDETLRRVVDWDLLLRLVDVTDLGYAPFISTRYAGEADRADRITVAESIGYRYEVRARALLADLARPARQVGRTTVVAVLTADDEAVAIGDLTPFVRRAGDGDGDGDGTLSCVLVDDGLDEADAQRLRSLEVAHDRVQVARIADRVSRSCAAAVGAALADGDVVVFLDPAVAVPVDVLERCAAAVRAGEADVVQPLWVDRDGLVAASGWATAEDGTPVTVGVGWPPEDLAGTGTEAHRDAPDPFAYAVSAALLERCGGPAPIFVNGGAEVDLGRRLREHGGRVAVAVDEPVVLDAWPAVRRHLPSHADGRELRRRGGAGAAGSAAALAWHERGLTVAGYVPVPLPRFHWRGPQRWGATYVRRPGSARRWAIKTSVPGFEERHAWGDWYFAHALRDALESLGAHAVVDTRRAWYRPTADVDDVDLVLRGTQRYEPPPGRTSLLWVISHPDEVTADEVARYDGAFVASTAYAEVAAARWQRPVTTLLQATDPRRFHPRPDTEVRFPLLFVGNSRGVRRRIVADAVDAGLEPAIFGEGWEGLVPPRLVHGTHVPNDQLGRFYASAEVVLADHWDDMRDRGFLANRLFDAVASGAAVVSDAVPGAEELFGGAVRTYHDVAELPDAVTAARRWREGARETPSDAHTFLARAQVLVDHVEGCGDGRP
jgi:GT2 family glycosyltransferase